MIDVRPLDKFDTDRFLAIASGYTTSEIYRISRSESTERIVFEMVLETLPQASEFRFPYSDEDLERYQKATPGSYCLGAFDGDTLVGISLAEPQEWNNTLWVWEFHVAKGYQGQGIGRLMMAELEARARGAGIRAIICETQNTNVPAINFYRAVGFQVEGVDISYYTNEDMLPGRTVAVFMKLRSE